MAIKNGYNQQTKESLTYIWGRKINIIVLIIHIWLLGFFVVVDTPAMAIFNCFSVICYLLEFQIIKRSPRLYLWVMDAEVIVHMVLACYFLGWDCDFQYYLFSMVVVVFFCDQAIKREGFPTVFPTFVSILSAAAFLVCCLTGYFYEPVYTLSEDVIFRLKTANGMIIMLMLIIFSRVYVNHVMTVESRLTQNAEVDKLTGISNRHGLSRVLKERGIGDPGGEAEYAVAILDLDDFKKVNDRFGHLAGDQVLRKMAVTLKGIESDNIIVARWGGEEFMVVAHGKGAYKLLMEKMQTIRAQIEQTVVFFENWRLRETVSIGVSSTKEALLLKELVEEADQCLYEAKGSGKNRVIGKWGTP